MMVTKMRRNIKAISPIFAVLILIAIAVIAGIIVYMFTSGTLAAMMGGGTSGQEKVAVQSVTCSTGGVVSVIYQSTGGPICTINGIIIKDASGNTVGAPITTLTGTVTPTAQGALTTVGGTNAGIVSGQTYTATLTTVAGGSFVSPSFVGK